MARAGAGQFVVYTSVGRYSLSRLLAAAPLRFFLQNTTAPTMATRASRPTTIPAMAPAPILFEPPEAAPDFVLSAEPSADPMPEAEAVLVEEDEVADEDVLPELVVSEEASVEEEVLGVQEEEEEVHGLGSTQDDDELHPLLLLLLSQLSEELEDHQLSLVDDEEGCHQSWEEEVCCQSLLPLLFQSWEDEEDGLCQLLPFPPLLLLLLSQF